MKLKNTDEGRRPVSDKDECFYCHVSRGHHEGCVLIKKSVVVTMTTEFVVEVPRDWTRHDIEFQRNEGNRCSDGDIRALADLIEKNDTLQSDPKTMDQVGPCHCRGSHYRVVRDATQEDHESLPCLASSDFELDS